MPNRISKNNDEFQRQKDEYLSLLEGGALEILYEFAQSKYK